MGIDVDDLTSYGPGGPLMDIINLGLETGFEVNNMEQLYWLLGMEISFNRYSIELSQEGFVDKIFELFLINEYHLTITSSS
jgi:hypothetical protein